jgi:hypothetical protein
LALSGDRPAYREYCQSLVDTFAQTAEWQQASRLNKACLLLPSTIDPAQLPLEPIVRKLGSGTANSNWRAWANGTRALVAYRAGDLDAASDRLDRASYLAESARNEFTREGIRILVSPLRAMIQHRQGGLGDLARQSLVDSRVALDGIIQRRPDGTLVGRSLLTPNGSVNHNAIIAEVLRREAEEAISTQSATK